MYRKFQPETGFTEEPLTVDLDDGATLNVKCQRRGRLCTWNVNHVTGNHWVVTLFPEGKLVGYNQGCVFHTKEDACCAIMEIEAVPQLLDAMIKHNYTKKHDPELESISRELMNIGLRNNCCREMSMDIEHYFAEKDGRLAEFMEEQVKRFAKSLGIQVHRIDPRKR